MVDTKLIFKWLFILLQVLLMAVVSLIRRGDAMMKTILIQLKLSVTSTWDLLKYIEKYLPALDAMLAAVGFLAICYGIARLIMWCIE